MVAAPGVAPGRPAYETRLNTRSAADELVESVLELRVERPEQKPQGGLDLPSQSTFSTPCPATAVANSSKMEPDGGNAPPSPDYETGILLLN